MLRQTLWVLFAIAISCAGCKPAPEPVSAPDGGDATRAPTVIDDQLQALDKAKAVQATLDKDAAATDKAIKDSGG